MDHVQVAWEALEGKVQAFLGAAPRFGMGTPWVAHLPGALVPRLDGRAPLRLAESPAASPA